MAIDVDALPQQRPSAAWPVVRARRIVWVVVLASAASLALNSYPVFRPWLQDDDFGILSESLTWQRTLQYLWRPWNEHVMPLGRLSTWLLVHLAGSAAALPRAVALQGPLAVLAAMWLLYLFVGRELKHAFYGLVAAILYGVSLKYNEAVRWFAASFAILAFDTLLLGLLAAQAWRRSGRPRWLVLSAVCAALAPGWFAAGVLAGPFCSLYLLASSFLDPDRVISWRRRLAQSAVPTVGTVLFLGGTLPFTGKLIQHTAHYGSQTATQAFAPLGGLALTGRMLVDNLLLGLNAFGVTCPALWVPVALLLIAAAGWCWWAQPRARRNLLVLGLGMIIGSYWLALSFRYAWPYEAMIVRWNRYNVMPFAGLILFVCGGLPGRAGTLFQLQPGGITRRQAAALTEVIGLMLMLQMPAGLVGDMRVPRERDLQMACLQRIDAVEAICRAHHIASTAVVEALGPLPIPHNSSSDRDVDGWWLLPGSATPSPHSGEEIRRLLGTSDVGPSQKAAGH